MLNSLQNDRSSLIFTTLLVHTTAPKISIKSPFLHFSQFSLPYSPLLVHKAILTILTSLTLSFPNPHQFFTFLFLHTAIPTNYTKSIFLTSDFSQYRLCQEIIEQESLARTGTVSISPFFLKVWTRKAGLTITDSLWLSLRKLMHCRM